MKIVGCKIGCESGNDVFGGRSVTPVTSPDELKGADLLVLWGGEDISPSIYGQMVSKAYATSKLSRRDEMELNLINAAVQLEVPILGFCRGAQMLCAFGGGKLWQDVIGHHGTHQIVYKEKLYTTNSIHHQMMIPTDDMVVLAVAEDVRSPYKYGEETVPVECKDPEPEIVYFPKLKALGIQGHPEWLGAESDLVKLTRELTKEYLNVAL